MDTVRYKWLEHSTEKRKNFDKGLNMGFSYLQLTLVSSKQKIWTK